MRVRHSICLVTSTAILFALANPEQASAQRTVLRSGVDMVGLTITVTDASGQTIPGLTARDFVVFDEGIAQEVSVFGAEEVPLDVVFVLDTSASMNAELPLVKKAAHRLIGQLRNGDRAAVVNVTSSVTVPQTLTDEHASVVQALESLSTTGSTALLDGVYTSLREFERLRRQSPELRRQVLVVLSDGLDNNSHVGFEDVADLARQLDVTMYTIALRGVVLKTASLATQESAREAGYVMRTLARETGGVAFSPTRASELETIYAAIGRELVNQYSVGYIPSPAGSQRAFRRVSVRVLPPAQGTARTRTGYFTRTTLSLNGRMWNDGR